VITCLFWNYRCDRRDQEAIAARVALHHQVDIIALAESTVEPDDLLGILRNTEPAYNIPPVQHERFVVLTRFPGHHLAAFRSHDRLSVRRLLLPGRKEVLFALIHFYDRMTYDREAQYSKCAGVRLTLTEAEKEAGHSRTVIVGDFNMNPFDKGMIDPDVGFGAMMSRSLALRHTSEGAGEPQRFYDPMWSRMGRELPDPPGTHYWPNVGDPFNLYWHSLDQVLVRPALLDAFRDEDFRILTSIPGPTGENLDLVRSTGKSGSPTTCPSSSNSHYHGRTTMPEDVEDFWPSDFTTLTDDPEPALLLKQQAKILGRRTNGVVEGVVKNSTVAGTVYYSLYLKAPALGDYEFKVLHIAIPLSQVATNPFPLTVEHSIASGLPMQVQNMDEFRRWLRVALSSEPVASVIGRLIKQSQASFSQ
jgi:hypothetical protein